MQWVEAGAAREARSASGPQLLGSLSETGRGPKGYREILSLQVNPMDSTVRPRLALRPRNVRAGGLEPPRPRTPGPKPGASAGSATLASWARRYYRPQKSSFRQPFDSRSPRLIAARRVLRHASHSESLRADEPGATGPLWTSQRSWWSVLRSLSRCRPDEVVDPCSERQQPNQDQHDDDGPNRCASRRAGRTLHPHGRDGAASMPLYRYIGAVET